MNEEYLAIEAIGACTGWLGALVFVIVGLTVVRKAHATAGYLVAAAGGLKIVVNCCAAFPTVYSQAGGPPLLEISQASVVLTLFLRLAVYALIGGAAIVMAKRAVAKPVAEGSSSWSG